MARKKSTKRKGPLLQIAPGRQREILGLILLALAGVTILSLASITRGALTEGWIHLLRLAFGWGYLLIPVILGAIGLWLVLDSLGQRPDVGWERPLGATLLFLVVMALLHILPFPSDPRQLAAEGKGGGQVGLLLSQGLLASIGPLGAIVLLLALAGSGLIMLLGLSTLQMGQALAQGWHHLLDRIRDRARPLRMGPPPAREGESLPSRILQKVTAPLTPSPPEEAPPSGRRLTPRVIGGTGAREWRLPPLEEILEENIEQELSQAEIRQRVRVIEETLASFGVPAKVVEVNQGPTITQFGVEPGYVERRDQRGRVRNAKVRVSKIQSLADDLALALAASPVRIEAPVPGRSVVGIEVPNSEIFLVALRGVIESEPFQKAKGPLTLALGRDVSGQPVVADLTIMPHLLIAGATGSGKSVCINAIITCLLCTHTPEELRLVMIDPKRVELTNFNGIPHLAAPVVVEIERVIETLRWATGEMDRRYKLFARNGARNIEGYNRLMAAQGEPRLSYLVVVIDELADLMMVSPDEVERLVCRIAQLARATGIHLVIATQRPSVDVVTGLIKANFPARISFAVTSQVDSRVVLDTGGAEKLLGRGDMLYMASDSSKLVRLQGCFVSDRELDRLVRYWKGMGPPLEFRVGDVVQPPLWEDMVVKEQRSSLEDDLWEEALDLIRHHRSASVSLLQRRLRIGYSRAARLVDLMEERGIVGPPTGPGKRREVLLDEEREWGREGS
jgi:S-DNA-T family DNA segregation ATPase FtsK/SpoIIIE